MGLLELVFEVFRVWGFGDLAFRALGSRVSVSGLGCRIISNVYHSVTARYCKNDDCSCLSLALLLLQLNLVVTTTAIMMLAICKVMAVSATRLLHLKDLQCAIAGTRAVSKCLCS